MPYVYLFNKQNEKLKKSNIMKTQDLNSMYKATFYNSKTKSQNITFLMADSIKEAALYCMKTFGDDFIQVETYLGVKRK
jgi:hypothetical protein